MIAKELNASLAIDKVDEKKMQKYFECYFSGHGFRIT